MIFDSLVWNGILGAIEMFLHDWWTADVDGLDCAGRFHLLELLSICILVHSFTDWLPNILTWLDLANSAVVSEQMSHVRPLKQCNESVDELKTHRLFFARKRSVKLKIEVIQIKRLV